MKLNSQKEVLERLKQQHLNEIENMRMEHTQNLTELRNLYENVIILFDTIFNFYTKIGKIFDGRQT